MHLAPLKLFIPALMLALNAHEPAVNHVLAKEKGPFEFKEAPPGTVWLRDSIYIDVNPVKNIDFKEFLSFIQFSYSQTVRDSLKKLPLFGVDMLGFQSYMRLHGPDKALAAKMKPSNDARLSWSMTMDEYMNSPTYKNYPMVNVSYTQAQIFSEWRTDMVMLFYSVNSKNEKVRNKKYYKKIRYRLPTAEELEYALEKFNANIFTNYAVYAGERCATIEAVPQKKKSEFVYIPRNVSEMTLTDKLAFGMSWKDTDTTNFYAKTVEYWGPRDWLGFRCVCEIVEY